VKALSNAVSGTSRKLIWARKTLNPYDPPDVGDLSDLKATPSGWWVAISYSMPLLIILTFMNADGWYGTGTSGMFQSILRIVAFFVGVGCAYYVLIFGTKLKRLAAAPAALGYTALALGILWDKFL
jgi:hypothetical protein